MYRAFTLLFAALFLSGCPTQSGFKSILLSPKQSTLSVGETLALHVFGATSDGLIEEIEEDFTLNVDNATIAEAMGGTLRALHEGQATVTVTVPSSGLTASMAIRVTNAHVVSLSIEPAAPALPVGARQTFSAKARYSDGQNIDVTAQATWASSTAAVATLLDDPAQPGTIETHSPGVVTISATFGATQSNLQVRVTSAELAQIMIGAPQSLSPKPSAFSFHRNLCYKNQNCSPRLWWTTKMTMTRPPCRCLPSIRYQRRPPPTTTPRHTNRHPNRKVPQPQRKKKCSIHHINHYYSI